VRERSAAPRDLEAGGPQEEGVEPRDGLVTPRANDHGEMRFQITWN
jgi:hypothetical protein